jgi:hypothetical protein
MFHLKFGGYFFYLGIVVLLLGNGPLLAQSTKTYDGYRLGLLNLQIRQQTTTAITLQCDAANTGRLPLDFNQHTRPPASLMLELDTVALPLVLRGRTTLLDSMVRRQKIKLSPGNIRYGLKISIPVRPLRAAADTTAEAITGACPDLEIDTVYLVKYTNKSMVLHYVVRNVGTAAAQVLGNGADKKDRMSLHVYFVSGVRMTRGAIFAGSAQVQDGPEIPNGWLGPGQLLQGEMEISLKNRTRFSPNLVLEIDPFQTIPECRRVNNTKTLIVEY